MSWSRFSTRGPLLGSAALVALLACGEPATDPLLEGRTDPARAIMVVPEKELIITDRSVIASPLETTFDPAFPSGTSLNGAWSFGRLVHNMLPRESRNDPAAASRLVMSWLATWEVDQRLNDGASAAPARPAIRLLILEPWKAASGCADPASAATDSSCVLDMAKAPFKLIAIVNRPDLRVVASDGTAIGGEGRFVFQVVGPTLGVSAGSGRVEIMVEEPRPQKFTVILEYSLPVGSNVETLTTWAYRWHQLGAIPFGRGYNAALRAITNAFAGPDQDRRRPNGSALNQLRTNEVALAGARFPAAGFVAARQVWELREFRLGSGGLTPHTVNLEPARDFDVAKPGQIGTEGTRSAQLAEWLETNSEAVLASAHHVPGWMIGSSALVGSAPYGAWGKVTNPNPPAVPAQGVAHQLGDVASGVRDSFAINTCAGCHRHETDTRHFMHVTALGAMEPADKVDDRARIGVAAGTPDDATVLSNFMAAEVSPGGGRFEDYVTLLSTSASALANKKGLRACR